jgi:hypothetical protein
VDVEALSRRSLVVLHPAPDELRSWLRPDTVARVHLIDAALAHEAVPEGWVAGLPVTSAGSWRLVRLSLDGPMRCVEIAAAGLREWLGGAVRRTAIVAQAPDARWPPHPELVAAITKQALIAGVDLARCRFQVEAHAVVTGRRRVAAVPVEWSQLESCQALARVIRAMELSASPLVEDWLEAVLTGEADPRRWSLVLAALHVEATVAAAADPGHG